MRVVLHTCCGPCSVYALHLLRDHEVTACFYNPNLYPQEEYTNRFGAARKVALWKGVPFIEGPHDTEQWLLTVKGMEDEPERGKRCLACINHRLCYIAALPGYDAFSTTLGAGWMKDKTVIDTIGKELGIKHGRRFLQLDLSAPEAFKAGFDATKQLKLYRQRYCGCRFSRSMASPKL